MAKTRAEQRRATLTYKRSLVPLYREKWLNSLPGGSIYEANRDLLDESGLALLTSGAQTRFINLCKEAELDPNHFLTQEH